MKTRVCGPEFEQTLTEFKRQGHRLHAICRGRGNSEWILEWSPAVRRQAQLELFKSEARFRFER